MRIALLLCSSLLVAPALMAQADPKVAGFEAYAAQAAKDWGAVGLAVAVIKDGKTIFAKGYGVRELGKPDTVNEHTLFSIGSTTKAITAAAIGMLVDEGKLRWDDPVTKHLPWFQVSDPYVTREITIRDLLVHRAGLANGDVLWYRTTASPAEVIRRARFIPMAYSFRSGFIYQNVMYATAGAVVAAVSGMSWERFIESRIFEPLGMSRTVATLRGTVGKPNVAAPHQRVGGEIRVISNAAVDSVAAAGSVWSSVSDMARWAAFIIDSGRANGRPLLKPATWAELLKAQTMVPPSEFYPTQQLTRPHWMTYGLGWFQHDYQGRTLQFHTGSIDGMVAIIGVIPEERLGIYVLGNLDHVEVRHALLYRGLDTWLGLPARDWSTDLRTLYGGLAAAGDSALVKTQRNRIAATKPSLDVKGYAGTYTDSLVGPLEVRIEEGGLALQFGSEQHAKMSHWHFDTFEARWDNSWQGTDLVTFTMNGAGVVDGLRFAGRRLGRSKP